MKREWALALLLITGSPQLFAGATEEWAAASTIRRDEWGVPHIQGPTDASVVFAFGYCQAEDYLWQVEDTYLQAIGRYAEAVGPAGLDADLLNHQFGVARRSREDFAHADPADQLLCAAFVSGLNHYLATHPSVKPRLITHYEPWQVLAFARMTMLDWTYGRSHASKDKHKPHVEELQAHIGSNTWALSPARTRDKKALLLVNPHQPWFGAGQFYEGHLKSDEGLNFSGATFFGGPFPTMGHNEHLGWAHTANNPDIADLYIEQFDHPTDPLLYRHGDDWKKAEERKETIKIKTPQGIQSRDFTFRATHHGPIIQSLGGKKALTIKIARLFEGNRLRQGLAMAKSTNYAQWRSALAGLNLSMFNVAYADREGNIFYVYHGAVPKRDPSFQWAKPVDGANPKTEWLGLHSLDELPQAFNPVSGFVQNCNATPFLCTDDGNPAEKDFPPYMVEDTHDNRRSQMSRRLLRGMRDVSFEDWKKAAFNNSLYWPLVELADMRRLLAEVSEKDGDLAKRAGVYLDHLSAWDGTTSIDSTAATLCAAWYEELYGFGYPAETLKPPFQQNAAARLKALVSSADRLQSLYGDWKVKWGDVHRMQRHVNIADPKLAPFSDRLPSIPCAGAPGPLGVVFNTYYTPATPLRKKMYGVVGGSFVAVYEFGPKVQSASIIQFGASADPASPHFFDQAKLYASQQFKPAWFHWDDVVRQTRRRYHPGGQDEVAGE